VALVSGCAESIISGPMDGTCSQHDNRTSPFQVGVFWRRSSSSSQHGDALPALPEEKVELAGFPKQHLQKQYAIISFPHVGIRNVVTERLISGYDVLSAILMHLVTKWPPPLRHIRTRLSTSA
jgi:hypothetical protein